MEIDKTRRFDSMSDIRRAIMQALS
jgi:hypothetical protein